ncbi:MAG: mannose-1-phosphate guanylyltransferase/mannose-6-phosphate isomerase [Pseudomonadota bacterium]
MKSNRVVPVILSGGTGSRLWPLSRELNPKQFLPLVSENSMLQETLLRLHGNGTSPVDADINPVIVCNEEHRFLAAEQLRQINYPSPAIILEPEGRNTAPAICVAAMHLMAQEEDPIMLVLPADHVILNTDNFHKTLSQGTQLALQGKLVTFGIVVDSAETGYGYIQQGKQIDSLNNAYSVARFVEKPDKVTAQTYLDSGDYLWNSGMFMFRCSVYIQELKKYQAEMVNCCLQAYELANNDCDFIRLDKASFSASPADSIDYAVMEKTDHSVVIPLDANWNDVGAWDALWELGEKDAQGNVCQGDILLEQVSNSYIHADYRLVAAIGLQNCIIIETADAILVADKNHAQDVKSIVQKLKSQKRDEAMLQQRVYRPWGSYETLDEEFRFKVKRIIVNPGSTLSLQMHHHRAEHWVIVRGTAKITQGDKEFILTEDQSTYIPLGTTHRLENPGVIPLEIIEIQSGSYLGEDDIVRFSDKYGRVEGGPVDGDVDKEKQKGNSHHV